MPKQEGDLRVNHANQKPIAKGLKVDQRRSNPGDASKRLGFLIPSKTMTRKREAHGEVFEGDERERKCGISQGKKMGPVKIPLGNSLLGKNHLGREAVFFSDVKNSNKTGRRNRGKERRKAKNR